jgi:hypothetical protein
MGNVRRYEDDARAGPPRRVVTGHMSRVGPVLSTDRQLEIARRYRRDGTLEAERLRVRERTTQGSYGQDQPGCIVAWLQATAGMAYVVAVPLFGYWVGGWVGAAVAFTLLSIQVASHW